MEKNEMEKTVKKLSIILFLALASCGSAELDQSDFVEQVRESLYFKVKGPEGWPLENPPEEKSDGIDPALPMAEVYENFLRGRYVWRCKELTALYTWVLRQNGFETRQVHIGTDEFLPDLKTYRAHFFVEVMLGGRWVIQDPTFNTTLQCDGGEDASVDDLIGCRNITWRAGQQIYGKGRRMEEYPLRFEDLLPDNLVMK